MSRTHIRSKTAREYRAKYPDLPTSKLARIMLEESKLIFKDFESARIALRYIEGKMGKNMLRKSVTESEFYKEEPRPMNPYNLPKSDETIYEPYKISGFKKIGILSDIHLPYHNIEALTCAINYLKKEKVDAVLLNGDTMDCHHLSRFLNDPKKRDFKYELDALKVFVEVLEKQLKCKIFFKIGNHEARYEKFLLEKAHELRGIEEFDFENIIKARAKGIEVIASNRYMKLNELNGIHGHEYIGGISAPVNVARGLYLKGKVSAFQGHNHSTSEHSETDMNGKITTTWSVGCLCELHPAYMPLNKWNWGCAMVELDSNGRDYQFFNKRIFDGRIL
jgi:predicted phosphodiesterase